MSIETTKEGESFYERPLGQASVGTTIGLPGLGPAATEKLKEFGLIDAAAVFGQYIAFCRNREVFIDYLERVVGVRFVGNNYATSLEVKKILCDTLDAKWNKIKEY